MGILETFDIRNFTKHSPQVIKGVVTMFVLVVAATASQ
jgi:hypothetical protein